VQPGKLNTINGYATFEVQRPPALAGLGSSGHECRLPCLSTGDFPSMFICGLHVCGEGTTMRTRIAPKQFIEWASSAE